ncbi:MAG: aminotransferase class I/II-fold pyridoxal phosphate-dependent enzyme [Pseudomonadota bacterium]
MTTKGSSKKLNVEDRRAALSSVRRTKNRASSQPAQREPLSPVPDANVRADFSILPGFREMRLQKAAAELLEIDNPFFRAHDGRASALTRIGGKEYINFSSYDYLGLNGHPAVQKAARDAVDRYGISAGASRVVGGERPIHRDLERKIAEVYGVEDAVVFVSGHATNVSTIGQLLQPEDTIIHDAFIHNSIVTGARLSGASRQSFPHNDFEALEGLLRRRSSKKGKVLVAVEGVYSMDGDCPDLTRLVELKRRYGFWLMVDEAHALGILGKTGRGLHEHWNIDANEVDIWMGTCSKTLAGCGGYIAGSRDLTEYLKFSASGFVFSVGMPPPVAASISAAIDMMLAEPERVERVQEAGRCLLKLARQEGLETGTSDGHAVVPVMIGDSIKATTIAARLLGEGVNVLPIIYPAVPERSSRLRFFVTSDHTEEQLKQAVTAVSKVWEEYDRDPVSLAKLAQLAAG